MIDSTENEIFGFDVVGGGGEGDCNEIWGLLVCKAEFEEAAVVAQKRAAAEKKLAGVIPLWAMGGGGRKRAEWFIDSSSLSAKARLLRALSLMICAETACIGKSAHAADGRLLDDAAHKIN